MNKASKTAIGGLAMALSVVLMIPTALEIFVYALPAFAGLITLFCVVELNKKWAFGVYVGAAVISLLLVPNKEASVLYAAFFGYYPIVKALLEERNMPRVLEYVLKFLIFNVSVVASYLIIVKVMGIPFDELMGIDDSSSILAKYGIPIFLALGNLAFIMLDKFYSIIVTLYVRAWQKRFRKLFRIKH